jgi:hypothetical protein
MADFDIEIQEGGIYPGWQKPFEASVLNIVSEGLHLLISIPFPRPLDMEDFKNLTGYGVFGDEYPLVIWKFGKNFLLPTPCNPEFERQESPEDVEDFFSGIHTDFSRVMLDSHGIIRVLRQTRLREEFMKKLHSLWTVSNIDWEKYNDWLQGTFQTPTHHLWEHAIHFDS